MNKKSVVVMGGSFNPPTIAHLGLMQKALDAVNAEKGFFVPVSFPYLKRKEEPFMPLTTMEKRWMKAVLLDPRIRLFDPDIKALEDIEPLFTPDMVVYYDRYSDGDDYADPGYIRHFRVILKALRENRSIYVSFQTGLLTKLNLVVTPYYLEYSEKDDRFRLIAAGRKRRWVINLSRIKNCELAYTGEGAPLREAATGTVTFELEDRRNAMERVLLHSFFAS